MSTAETTRQIQQDERAGRLEAYRLKADPVIALISSFYLVLLLIPRVVITSWDSNIAITVLDVLFWTIITADVAYRAWLTPIRRNRLTLLAALALLLTGPFVFLAIPLHTRYLIRLALIAVVSLRAFNSVRFFFRLRSILYIISAVILMVVVFGVVITFTERDAPHSNITSLGSGIWWAAETVSTVGYGDTFPVTDTGRVIATGLMFFGVAVFSILTATLANSFARRAQEEEAVDEFVALHERLDRIEQSQSVRSRARRTRAPSRPSRRTPPPAIGMAPAHDQE
jgi:voltage-gated potassium channel